MIKKEVNSIKNVTFLDGQIIDLNGIKLSGMPMWYDTSYLKSKYPGYTKEALEKRFIMLWKMYLLDSSRTNSNPINFFEDQKEKLEKVYKDIDIMVSHVNPVNNDHYFNKMYRGEETNTFFCFNGIKYLEEGSIKHWIFGHTHSELEDKIFDVQLHCNPMGYPGENSRHKIKQFEIKK
jgi:hypothetical protein